MDFLFEKIAYLKGLADGLEVSEDTKEGKLFAAIIDVLEEMAESMDEIVEEQDDMNEYLDLVDEDLSKVEEEIFGEVKGLEDFDDDFELEEDFDDDFEGGCGCGCSCHDED